MKRLPNVANRNLEDYYYHLNQTEECCNPFEIIVSLRGDKINRKKRRMGKSNINSEPFSKAIEKYLEKEE